MRAQMMVRFITVLALASALVGGAAAKNDKNTDWPAYAGDKGSTKYSPLDQINKDSVKNLKIAWRRSPMLEELRDLFPNTQAPANYQHTPLVVGGVMYISHPG